MKKGIAHLALAAIALLLLLCTFALVYFNYFKPDIVLAATTIGGAVLTAATVLRGPVVRIWKFLKAQVGEIIPLLDRHVLPVIAVSCTIILGSVWAVNDMLTQFVKRYRYVNEIRSAVASVISDHAEMPNTQKLVEAYISFPGRREVPAIFVRTGRIFTVAGGWEHFIKFQKTYADHLYEAFRELPDWCSIAGVDHDPVSYVATTYLESSVTLENGEVRLSDSFSSRLKRTHTMLTECPETSDKNIARKSLPRMIYAARVRSVLAKDPNYLNASEYNPNADIEAIEKKIEELTETELVWLFQSHAYQEFLDFRIKTTLTSQCSPEDDFCDTDVAKVAADVRRLLTLRMTVGIDNEMRWIRPPQKMDTFRMFMVKGGYMPHIQDGLLPCVENSQRMSKEINEIFSAPVFQSFLRPDVWYKSTPLDLSIEGASLKQTFEGWLKTGW